MRAAQLTQEWTSVVEGLVRQLEQQEVERRRLLQKISALERAVQVNQTVRDAAEASATNVTDEDLQAVQYVADSLVRDPDHIVTLAGVSQNAQRFHRVVSAYVRLQRSLQGRPDTQGPVS